MTDWTVSKNYEKGRKNIFKKSSEEKATERMVVMVTKHHRRVINAYCEKMGITYGDLFRMSISEFFNRVGWDLPPDQQEDPNQLKIFPEQ